MGSESVHKSRISDLPSPELARALDLFRATGGLYVVLTPDLRIVDASEEYLRSTLLWREEISGCSFFDVFPDNPNDPMADGVENLKISFQNALNTGRSDQMPIQQYDVRDHVSGEPEWVEKFWAVSNSVVYGSVVVRSRT